MVSFYGDYNTTETVVIPFNTFSSDDPSASVTITELAAADVEIHKDGSTTQRASDNGVTVSIDFDGVTGNHIVSIDLSDNSDAGFYAVGSRYQVRMEGTTVDGATINAWIGAFSIGCTLRPTTAGRTLDIESGGCAGFDWGNIANPTFVQAFTNTVVGAYSTARAGYLDELASANMPADLDLVLADTNELQTNQGNWLTATTVALTAAGQQDIAQLVNARPTWYVNKSGDDGNSGTSWDDAFLTIGAAVSAASAGDKIVIGPGTYAEAVDSSALANLEIVGAGLQTLIQTTSAVALTIGNGAIVRNLKAESTHASGKGISANVRSDVVLADLVAIGPFDGLQASSSNRLRVYRSYLSSNYDGANMNAADDWQFIDTILETDGTHASATHAAALYTGTGSLNGHVRGQVITFWKTCGWSPSRQMRAQLVLSVRWESRMGPESLTICS
jgi:hypothetical protein